MPLSLTLIRHGVTDWNLERRFQGHSDVSLNAEGRSQAEALAARLHGEGRCPRALIASDLSRAMQTAAPVAETFGLDIRPEEIWRERQLGCFEGRTGAELRVLMPAVYAAWRQDLLDVSPPGAETYREHQARVAGALEQLRQEFSEGEILVVTHGGSIYSALGLVYGSLLPKDPGLRLANTSLTELVWQDGKWHIKRVNCASHLGPEVCCQGAFSEAESKPPEDQAGRR
jgi:probable phosphoglycerate mutase